MYLKSNRQCGSNCLVYITNIVNMIPLFALFLLLLVNGHYATKFNYYWRDYYGEIPDDAIPGGLDKNQNPTYIAQVFIPQKGVHTTRLYQGDKSVTSSQDGINTSDVFIKILCSSQPEKLWWLPANATHLHTQTLGKHVVVGGTENGKILNVGRIAYQNEVIVGKVCGYNVGSAYLYFPYHNKEVRVPSYEVLICDEMNVQFSVDVRMKNSTA